LKESAKDSKAITEVAHFSPSNNVVSFFACRICSGSGDGIDNVSATVLY